MGNLSFSPARFHNLQVLVILSAGVIAAIAAYILHFLAFLLLVMVASLAYCFFRYLLYDLEAASTRDGFSRLISDLVSTLAASQGSPRGQGDESEDESKRVLVTSRGTVPIVVHRESQKLMQMICRDFVLSWYSKISRNPQFPQEVVGLLDHVALQISLRIQRIDHHDLVLNLLAIIQPYLLAVNDIGLISTRGKVAFNVEHPDALLLFQQKVQLCHRALSTEKTEMDYLRKLVDTFICASIPPQYKNCDIAVRLVREVLVYKFFKPLVDLLCSPGFIMEAIPKVLTKATVEQIKRNYADMGEENRVLEEELASPDGLLASLLFSDAENMQTTTRVQESEVATSSQPMSESNSAYQPCATQIAPWPEQGAKLLNPDSKSVPLSKKRSSSHVAKHDGPLCEVGEAFEQSGEMVHVDFPPVYLSRHVTVEIDHKQHIGYIIKFPKRLLNDDDLSELDLDSSGEAEALKRYSEFATFHRQLLKSEHSSQAKTLLLPDKQLFASFMSKLPFSSEEFSPTIILMRKEGLGNYVQSLYHLKEIRESKLFQDFLFSGVKFFQCATIVRNSKELPQPSVAAKPRPWSSLLDWMKTSVADEQPKPPRDIRKSLTSYLENNLPLPYHAVLMSSDHTHLGNQASSPPEPSPRERLTDSISGKIYHPTYSLPTELRRSSSLHNATTSLPLELTRQPPQPRQRTGGIAASCSGSASETDPEQSGAETRTKPDVAANSTSCHFHKPSSSSSGTFSNSWYLDGLWDLCGYIGTAAVKVWTFLYLIVNSFFTKPVTPESLMALANEHEKRSPLANCLLCLANEATRSTSPELWITNETSQLALLGIFGKAMDTYLWKELDAVVKDDRRWARALYNLRHTVWPGGKLKDFQSVEFTHEEREGLLKDAATSVQNFLPSALPYIIGRREYDNAVDHCLRCLLNPRINRHLLYKVIDILMLRLVPELNSRSFQQELMLLRTHPFYLQQDF